MFRLVGGVREYGVMDIGTLVRISPRFSDTGGSELTLGFVWREVAISFLQPMLMMHRMATCVPLRLHEMVARI